MTSTGKKESLEERLERIRKKNEEIEAKHKLAERDRMIAKMQNALVDTKPSADDWPREHKYDKLDITYDVSESQLEAEKAAKLEQQQRRALKAARFTDIPPDPNSFLADEERDGIRRQQALNALAAASIVDKNKPKGRQITGRKKFPPKSASTDFGEQHVPNPNWRKSIPDGEYPANDMAQDFSNLTVSVSQDGDFKSVRLTQAPVIGSGRVGPRQITKTQFQPMMQPVQFVPNDTPFDKNLNFRKSDRRRSSDKPNGGGFGKEPPKRSNSFKTTPTTPPMPIMTTGLGVKPFSVQDRLKRAVQSSVPTAATEPCANKNVILNIISNNEIIAAENHRSADA